LLNRRSPVLRQTFRTENLQHKARLNQKLKPEKNRSV
jgi:hypothetical protein